MPKTGYPDIEIFQTDCITYLEMKTSAVKVKSSFRYFYYTYTGKLKQMQDIFFWIYPFHKKERDIGR